MTNDQIPMTNDEHLLVIGAWSLVVASQATISRFRFT